MNASNSAAQCAPVGNSEPLPPAAPAANDVISFPAEGTINSLANAAISSPADGTINSTANGTISSPADAVMRSLDDVSMSLHDDSMSPSANVPVSSSADGTPYPPASELPPANDISPAPCLICPRKCGINRAVRRGFCGEMDEVRIAYAGLHFGEEPPITGRTGSGTVFFTGCNLRCSFCQNYQVSQCGMGRAVDRDEFVRICLALQEKGAANINLVTASHIVPRLGRYLLSAREAGVTVPYCWNSSAYECTETLESLKGLVTVWLPDLKTLSQEIAKGIFDATDYGEVAAKAILWMIDNNPLRFDGERLVSGVIVRHLFLPGRFFETADVLEWLHLHADGRAIISLMTQYTPIVRRNAQGDTPQSAPTIQGNATMSAAPPADVLSIPSAGASAIPSAGVLSAPSVGASAISSARAYHPPALSDTPTMSAISAIIEDRFVNMGEITDLKEIAEAYNFEHLYYQDLSEEDIHDDSWLPDFGSVHTFPNNLAVPVWHWKTGLI